MADTYSTVVPEIVSAVFSVNPATINQSIVLTVKVTEITIDLEPEKRYSGELYSGEV